MTGLDKIKEKIEEQSRENCEKIFAETNLKIKKMIAEAREEGNRRAAEIVDAAQREADKKNAVSKSTAESITRNRYLEIRNAILNDIISAAYLSIDKFSDEEYFNMIFSLCKKKVEASGPNLPVISRLLLAQTVLSVELLDTAARLSCLLLASVERMALGADLDVDLGLGRTGNKCVSTVAGNGCLIIFRMDSFSHD